MINVNRAIMKTIAIPFLAVLMTALRAPHERNPRHRHRQSRADRQHLEVIL